VNLTKFNKAKCKVLHMGQGKPEYQYRLGDEWIESSSAEDILGLCAPATQKAVGILGCIKRSTVSWSGQGR